MAQDTTSLIRTQIFARFQDYLRARGDVDLDDVDADSSLADIGVDSLDLAAIAQTLQDELDAVFDDQGILALETVGDLLAFAAERLDGAAVARLSEVG